jgi:dTDP-4-dehydrorhamnose reductase
MDDHDGFPDFAHRGTIVCGNEGRLGRALMTAAPGPVHGWDRPLLDLDDPYTGSALVDRDKPDLVIHTAAMTDVDHAGRDPGLAMRRNGVAVSVLAQACREIGAKFMLISTNEVFDGERTDGQGYLEDDDTNPRNPYGASKRAGEEAALEAYEGTDGLWIVRTSWLFGPPGADFPEKITAASDKYPDSPLPVVSDEIGAPTYTLDLARAIYELVERTDSGIYHLVNSGRCSRYDWARAVLDVCRPERELRPITLEQYKRHSDPPPWGALDTSKAAAAGVVMRPWNEALAQYLAE